MQAEFRPAAAGVRNMVRRCLLRAWHAVPLRIVLGLAMLMVVPLLLPLLLDAAAAAWPPFDAALHTSPAMPGVRVNPFSFYIVAVAIIVLSVPIYGLFVRWTERRAVAEIDRAGAWHELAWGILLGGGMFSCVILILWSGGHYRVAGFNPPWMALPALIMSASAAVLEELMFRGVIFRLLEAALGTWLALAISALLFGLVHLSNPHASLTSAAAIALEAGVLLGAAYMLTRRLWLVIGVHFAWDFMQGGVFGVPVSGIAVPGLLTGRLEGPRWLTGGAFGVEASAAAIAVCFAITIVLLRKARERYGYVRPFWRRAT
jgi:membrane protease YdiL (CAAX protease family)